MCKNINAFVFTLRIITINGSLKYYKYEILRKDKIIDILEIEKRIDNDIFFILVGNRLERYFKKQP